jgi:hypothetical protein
VDTDKGLVISASAPGHFWRPGRLIALLVLSALALGACSSSGASAPNVLGPMAAASAAPADLSAGNAKAAPGVDNGAVASASAATTQIVKTGQMSLEVSDLAAATAKAKADIVALGGNINASQTTGEGDQSTASVTYRLPVDQWDQALSDLHGLGKLLSEQTNVSDVSAQVIDLEARLTNLKASESALLAIMVRATAITDVLAVQSQLTTVQGEIEQLTAQRDYLKDQAAMSTLTVIFSLPGQSVVTTTTSNWDIGQQVDQASAALVKIGQALVVLALWALIVGVPLALGLLILLLIFWLIPRWLRRRRNRTASTP